MDQITLNFRFNIIHHYHIKFNQVNQKGFNLIKFNFSILIILIYIKSTLPTIIMKFSLIAKVFTHILII